MRIAGWRSAAFVLCVTTLVASVAVPAQAAGIVRVEAESYTAQRGTRVVPAPYPADGLMVEVSNGDWLRYDRVTAERVQFTLFCFASPAPAGTEVATLEVRVGSVWTAPVQTIAVRTNIGDGIKEWAGGGPFPDGVHTVYLRVRQPRGARPFTLDYLLLSEFPPPPSLNCP